MAKVLRFGHVAGAEQSAKVVDCSKCEAELEYTAANFPTARGIPYGRTCKQCKYAQQCAWVKAHPEAQRATRERYEALHPERVAAHNAARDAYLKAHPKENAAKARAWRAKHPEVYRALIKRMRSARRARLRGAAGAFTPTNLRAQFDAQGGLCFYCGVALERYHVEHKTPLSRGGSNAPDNIVCACPACNLRKGRKTAEEFVSGEAA